jgi:predicted nucleic acid-binding protein
LIVADASVVADFLLGRPTVLRAVERELVEREHEPLHAPELVEPETLNALRRLARAGAIKDRRATEAAFDLAKLRMIRYSHAPLRERVWELRHELTAYDATYLALAEALGGATLITADAGLATRATRSLGADRVRHVS